MINRVANALKHGRGDAGATVDFEEEARDALDPAIRNYRVCTGTYPEPGGRLRRDAPQVVHRAVTSSFFLPELPDIAPDAIDRAYRNVRDLPHAAGYREFVEEPWTRFSAIAEPDFRLKAATALHLPSGRCTSKRSPSVV